MMAAEYEQLVEELEGASRDSESAYRTRVALLAALGYVYVIAVVALLLWAVWLIFGVVKDGRHLALLKFAVPMAVLAAIGVRALFVRLEAPQGIEVTALEAPRLFAVLDKVRRKVKGPPIHQVLVTDEFNASIVQLSRFGLLGVSRNYLIIGLPLMHALSVEQFAAVLAHEYGHLSGAHGKFAAWIYRIRLTWARILDALLARPMWGAGLFLRFFRWYVPYFEAYTFVLARAQEYEADRLSAKAVGERHMADALVQVELGARFFADEFWPRYVGAADKSPRPAMLPFAQFPITVGMGVPAEDAQMWLAAALRRKTDVNDTHPCLKERLEALGQGARVPEKPAATAARALLEAHLPVVTKRLDDEWAEGNLRQWKERFDEGAELKERAAQIAAKAKAGTPLNGEEWFVYGRACERLASGDKAQEYYRKAIEVAPDYAEANLALGAMLLKRRDESGLRYLDRAIEAGGEIRWEACGLAARYLREAGRDADADAYELKMHAQYAAESIAEEHRVFLMPEDTYAPHGLPLKELELCRETFKRLPRVYKAYAVRKIIPGGTDSHLVFMIEVRVGLVMLVTHAVMGVFGMTPKEDPLGEEVSRALRLNRPFSVFLDIYLANEVEEKVAVTEDALIFDENDR